MKAAIINTVDSPILIKDLILPDDLQFGQILVSVVVSGLCGAQLQEIRGEKNNSKFMPHLTGHEGCGIVQKIGPGVTKVNPGDKVIMHWRKSTGIESPFPYYFLDGEKISGAKINTLAEQVIVSENRVTQVPPDIDDDFCALMGCGLSTSFSVINNDAKLKFGESILVIGCGGVGLGCINSSKMLYASEILGIDLNSEKKDLVEKNGGSFFLEDDCLSYIKGKKLLVDCIVDTVGDLNLVSKFLPYLSNSGRCILVSLPKKNTSITVTDQNGFFGTEGKKIISTQAGGFDPDKDINRFISLYRSGKLNYSDIVTHRFSLDEINLAVDTLRSGVSGRILIDIKK